jgi:hypothetical protein
MVLLIWSTHDDITWSSMTALSHGLTIATEITTTCSREVSSSTLHACTVRLIEAVLEAMLDDAEGGPLTLKTLSRTYLRRQREHKETNGEPLGIRMRFVSLLIAVGFINAETTGHPSPEHVRTFYTEERLEDYILENSEPRSLRGLLWKAVILQWHMLFSN